MFLFGSVLHNDFTNESDIDVMVTFKPKSRWSLFDHIDMEEELAALFHRHVDLLSKDAVTYNHNKLRRQEILSTAKLIYEERSNFLTLSH